MIRLKAFSTLLLILFSFALSAQQVFTVSVVDIADRQPLPGARLIITSLNGGPDISVFSDVNGEFSFRGLNKEIYDLEVNMAGYAPHFGKVVIPLNDTSMTVKLSKITLELKTVRVVDKRNELGLDRLRTVEGMALFAGKKTELIVPENMTINAATNNARQLYSRVAGLNIYENDGAGLQLSIGGRGLDPNRTANFNVRQNGYDISADALGYPESYYTPPVEAIDRIQIVRGAASLQYGTQFGGLLNFILKKPNEDQAFEVITRQSGGSYGFFNTFNSVSGTTGKLGYYGFFQYKRGDGWKPNSTFNAYTGYANLSYRVSENSSLNGQYTRMNYLAQQSGGLTDRQFDADPRQSNRSRNWFEVNWNLFSLEFQHHLSKTGKVSVQGFGLHSSRLSLGFRPNRPETPDDNGPRDLIDGQFKNWGVESRFMQRYMMKSKPSILLLGARYYQGFNKSKQGEGSSSASADFKFVNPEESMLSDYKFPSKNVAFFAENVFFLSEKLSLTPGFRFEHISTSAEGYYRSIQKDLAGNIIENSRFNESISRPRSFILMGLGSSYKHSKSLEVYANLSQNYRSITFNDIRVVNPSFTIDPDIKDENGYSADIGFRGISNELLNYDISAFAIGYQDRIGEIQFDDGKFVKRKRSNIGKAFIAGIESYAEINLVQALNLTNHRFSWTAFGNLAFIQSRYTSSQIPGVEGKELEFVPDINLKTGTNIGYGRFKTSFQSSYLSRQFTDATNATNTDATGVIGVIPSYHIFDLSAAYEYRFLKFGASINNLSNNRYFTRRATGYPGPGILPSDGRSFFLTMEVKF